MSGLDRVPPAAAAAADRSLGEDGRGLDRLLEYTVAFFEKHTGRIPTPALNNALAELRQARQPPLAAGQAAEPALRRAGLDAAAAIRIHVNDPGLVDTRLRLLGRERAAETA